MEETEQLIPTAIEFIEDKLLSLFGINKNPSDEQYDKFHKSFDTDEVKKELKMLFVDPKKMLTVGINRDAIQLNPKEGRRKTILILKTNKEEGLCSDMSKNFLFIEIPKKVLEEMFVLCNDIFFPMLTENVQQADSSELISKELMEKFHNFLSHFYVTLGHMNGETRLPEPSDEIFRNPKINDNEKTQICEGAVVMWIDLIKYILKQEPEHEFRNGGNPLPPTEIEFWKKKSEALASILNQIKQEKISEILKFLEKQKSTYHKMFNEIKKDVVEKEKEAKYNYTYLRCLEKMFDTMSEDTREFPEIAEDFVPMFHIIKKIWNDNEYYAKPERLIVLIRKMCNAIIYRAQEHIHANIFNKIINEPDAAINTLEQTRDTIKKFTDAYFQYKDNDENGWKITRNVIFYRLDTFNDRIGDILNIAKSFNEFSKMSTKTMGGIKGEALIQTLQDIFNECQAAVKEFDSEEYDPLDIGDETFNVKYAEFKETLKELERKISAVLTQTFDENDTIMGKFKVLDNFDTILERPYIVVELEKKYNILLDLFKEELRVVQNLFLTGKKQIESNDPNNPLNKNMPPIAALLNWTDSLKSRIKEPLEKFKLCGKRITEKEEFAEINNSYESIYKMIDEYGKGSKEEWDKKAQVDSIEKQKIFILAKKGDGEGHDLLNVNFDPELLQLLKEVKYLKILEMEIPKEADEAFAKNSTFRKQISNLENIKAQYNSIILQLNEVEKPMVENKLNRVETALKPALEQITWEQTKEIDQFTKNAHKIISELADTVNKLKIFVAKIDTIFKEWLLPENMLFQKPTQISEADAVSTRFIAYYEQERSKMATKVKDISNLGEVQIALKSAVSNLGTFKETDEWKNYQHYINKLVLDGSKRLICENLRHLSGCLDPTLPPFCSVRLLLEDRKIVYRPDFTGEDGKSIKSMILEWINSFLNLSTLFRIRVDTGMGDYMIEVTEDYKIQEIVYKLYNECNELAKESDSKMDQFGEFKVLWEKDFEESFQQFLKENTTIPTPTPEQEERQERIDKIFNEKNPNPITKDIVEYTPSKETFDDKINEYKDKLKKVQNMPSTVKVRWVEIDFTDFKNELTKIIETWIENYKAFLKKNSSIKLQNIKTFMDRVDQGIINKPTDTTSEEDKKKFFSLLENIRDMDLLYPKIIELIPSIKGELEILKKHTKSENEDDPYDIEEKNVDSEEQRLIAQTEEVEKNVVELKKKVENANEDISELIDKEKENFRTGKRNFEDEVEAFRKEFIENAPKELKDFSGEEIKNAYEIMDNYYDRTIKLDEQKKKNNDMELLLKIPLSTNKQISDCLNDLKLYKSLWDYVAYFHEIFENWAQIRMDKVNANNLSDEISELKKALKTNVKKEVKQGIPAFNTLLKKTNEMDDTIQCIMLLKDKSIKPRHWKHLNEIIKKRIPYDEPEFSVNSLLELEIYNVKAAVEEEKTVAGDQEKIEIRFNKIEKTWQSEKFRMTNNLNKKTYDFYLFDHGQMDIVIENLEKDQNQLIQMSQKKGTLENFENMGEQINNKMEQLKTVNDVIKQWLKFQKNWEKLEVIFLKSDDIQNKLRNEYAQFKELDQKFREIMKDAYDYNTMIDVCTAEKKVTINEMSENIATCQNALDNYLETKKKIFPRFYFVSNDTLLNMLSSADYPNLINKNVKDCFDGIKSWEMKPLDDKNKSDTILAMLSADNGEVVNFDEPFVCEGSLVEVYLGKFETKMRVTLSEILDKAYSAVEWNTATMNPDKLKDNRHTWLNPFPAQLALLVTQVVWTEEVEHALEATDGGDDGALKDYFNLCVKRINHLIDRVRDEVLTRDLRVKIITVITVDVHARDVVETFSKMKPAIDSSNFNWKKQLRFKYVPDKKNCDIQICDFKTFYSFEYIGNTGRLVITPLTDRCYITLTQALNLILGGAPAGPAGTGKTETVKDLGRNLGLGVIVNNCSEQMDIETTARIFSGLAQTGFWGCFDEFNRISIEVLSVVSTQVKVVLDAMRAGVNTFVFEGSEINLVPTCGFFITMNPGYAGRTELPDNLKALFRSCAMVVPDLREICQNMLMSEGFSSAKPIAAKFITLYTLSRDLLSKQKHYDWGLRAIKSLLRQAGGLKRLEANKSKNEFYIIMKALFDFNKAKIVPDDLIIFERLLQDLFKESDSKGVKEEDINQEINAKIDEATECMEVGLQKDASFTTKTRQLKEILEVRHCLFVLGAPGSGKTSVWKTLFYTNMKFLNEESGHEKLSPKAITGNELFGYIDDKTKAWKYGILSAIMKKMCKNDPPYKETMRNKWIILDGDIDPTWIESLNTVMDDNKVLTLTNGDRFPLDEFMRLLFEISNLRNATLATVSRGGVLYINEKDIGITPFFDKWLKNQFSDQRHQITKRVLQEFFKPTFEKVKEWKDRYVAPVVEISLLQNFCCIFQNLIHQLDAKFNDMEDERKALVVEAIYFFSFMWGVGAGLIDRKEMNTHINSSMKSKNKLRFPDAGTCFDYYFDEPTLTWVNWKEQLKEPVFEETDLFSDIIIPNVEVTRLCRITEINMLEEKPVLFIGDPGTGKTAVVKYFMKNYMEELAKKCKIQGYTYRAYSVNFNSFTNSFILQNIIDSQITQRFSNRYGPLGNTKLIYFLDDLNMPQLDEYGTQSHVELLRQAIDYKEYFDRKDLEFKKVLEDILFIGCQNPKAGSFVIDLRLQRHFTLIGASEPNATITEEIYTFILKNHFKDFHFNGQQADTIDKLIKEIIEATVGILEKIRKGNKVFFPSATKFHYQWNMREISRVIDGILRSASAQYKETGQIYKLWFHECNRVYKDRLLFPEDIKAWDIAVLEQFKQSFKFESANLNEELKEPFIFVPFGPEVSDDNPNVLVQPKTYDALKTEIAEHLQRYNDEKGDLPLVLFDNAIMDICRIARIISNPCSHALLVGVGGSGKQSLSRLACFIKDIDISLPNLSGTDYNDEAFLLDLRNVMLKSVLKPAESPYCFLINDNHIIDEYFLVYINNFLSSYWVDEIFETRQDLEAWLVKSLKSAAPNYGFTKSASDYTMEGLFNYLIYRVKNNVHLILCMSPVGDTLRVRARKFPSILSGTSIDWFHEWPDEALTAVSARQIGEMPQFEGDENMIKKLSEISAELHKSIKEFNDAYFKSERRYNYTTPKSFLELINYFTGLVGKKDGDIDRQIARLEKGLAVVANASESIAGLKKEIEAKSVIVEEEQKNTSEVLARLEVENEKISGEKEIVEKATAEAIAASEQAAKEKEEADKAFAEAEPAKEAARKEAENIKKDDLDKFKNPNNPSKNNFQVFKLMYLIFNPDDKMPGDDIKKELPNIKNKCLNASSDQIKQKMIQRLDNITWVTPEFLEKVKMYREYPYTDPKEMEKISGAVKGVVGYFQNLVNYNRLYLIVDPLLKKSQQAKATAEAAFAKKEELEKRLEAVSGTQRKLQAEFDASKAKKDKVEAEQAALMEKLATAEKFIGLLASNNIRWKKEVETLKNSKKNIAGDCLLGSSFVSYIGVFNSFFRERIINKWKNIIIGKDVSVTENIDIVHTLTTEGDILKMKAEGLPSDPFSTENAVIITQCTRYPLIIDPQMQAIAWLRNKQSKKTIVQYRQQKWDQLIGEALGSGDDIIIEDVDQEIDPMLGPIMGKQTTNKDKGRGGAGQIRVGSSDYPFNPKTSIYFITKISNPHYKPEIVAQCTLINFIVTEKGLEDQLLAMVVNIEQPELEESIRKYVTEINEFQAELILKEDDVLVKLSEADEATILDNKELINSLEVTKTRATQIEESQRTTEALIIDINKKREIYRGVGEEGAMLFFLISKLFVIQDMYQYSLNSFVYFFEKAIANTPKNDNLIQRVAALREKIRITVYIWISAGMFEKDKQLLLTMIAIRLLQKKGALTHESLQGITQKHIDFLLKCPQKTGVTKEKSVDFLENSQWESLCWLSDLDGLQGFSEKIEKEYSSKFKEWYNEINPEDLDLPPEWKKYKKYSFHKILVLRACRPERVGIALNEFIKVCLPHGEEFLYARTFSESLLQSYFDSKPEVPIFFILSPGSNPIKDLEILGGDILPKKIKKKFTKEHGFKYIAMGQNAEKGAEEELRNCNSNGEWLFLQNIHLMPKWLKTLEEKMKEIAKEKGHEDFRLYLSAEPSPNIPVGILEKCIKLTNEPPSGLKENMKIAFTTLKTGDGVNPIDDRRRCGVIFGLSYYHAVVIERKKFGSLGWNRNYPFNLDDLRNSDAVVAKYLEAATSKIPWEDLKYIVGEIMYGGHIVDDMDRVLNNSYLDYILGDKLLEDLDLVPYPSNNPVMKVNPIKTPLNNAVYPFETWASYIDAVITSESPALFGLHPNAELEYRITETNTLFRNLIDLEPKESGGDSGDSEGNRFDAVKGQCDDITAKSADGLFDIIKMKQTREGELTPDQNVFMQECEQMRALCELIKKNCKDICDAIDGKLTMDERIEQLIFSLSANRVPAKWISDGFATNRPLGSWLKSLVARIEQLKQFEGNDNTVPKVVFINRLFNPLSYLTAIRQLAARKLEQELDKLDILTEPSNYYLKDNEPQGIVFKESQGVPIYGLHLQGCRFDEDNKVLEESRPKENFFVLPIIFCKVMSVELLDPKKDLKNSYICPIYKTIDRQSTFVCFAQFRTKAPPAKWTIAGVAVILDCEKTDNIVNLKI